MDGCEFHFALGIDENPINHGKNHLQTGAGFCPSTVRRTKSIRCFSKLGSDQFLQVGGFLFWLPCKDIQKGVPYFENPPYPPFWGTKRGVTRAPAVDGCEIRSITTYIPDQKSKLDLIHMYIYIYATPPPLPTPPPPPAEGPRTCYIYICICSHPA